MCPSINPSRLQYILIKHLTARLRRTHFLTLSLRFHQIFFRQKIPKTVPGDSPKSARNMTQKSLPYDIALKIALSLQVSDVCSLGSCSRFWRELCGSDCVWASLCRRRWATLDLGKEAVTPEGWRGFYIEKHSQMASIAAVLVDFVEQYTSFESIEVVHHLAAIEILCSMQFGFEDVQMFVFKPKLNVLLNLVGLHYCISWLGVPAEYLVEALNKCSISERQVCVQWWKLGRWFYGFRMRDESHGRRFTLGDLAMAKEEEVIGVLHRGAIHEVLRVQISVAKPVCTPWSSQSTTSQN